MNKFVNNTKHSNLYWNLLSFIFVYCFYIIDFKQFNNIEQGKLCHMKVPYPPFLFFFLILFEDNIVRYVIVQILYIYIYRERERERERDFQLNFWILQALRVEEEA